MPVRVSCPHCRAPCLVAEQHLGVPVQCGRCARTFTTRADAASAAPALVRLDIGAATAPGQVQPRNENNFLVRQMSWCNLDERHELAMLAITKDRGGALTALAPLLSKLLNGTAQDAAALPEAILAALREANTVVVIWDGQVHVSPMNAYRVYHQRAGRLAQVTYPLKLVRGDWLFVVGDSPHFDAAMLQAESATSSSAAQLAQQLGERSNQTVLTVRCC